MADKYEEILAGTVALGYLDCTLLEYARGIKYFVDEEARKYNCDTHLVNMLRRAACVGWENIHMFKQPPNFSPADAEQLVRLWELAEQAIKVIPWLTNQLDRIDNQGAIQQGQELVTALRHALGTQEGKTKWRMTNLR